MSKFTLVLPVYNVEKYIKQCIVSIQNQTFTDFEVLIVDDCGPDKSIEIARELIENDERFRIIHHDVNKGLSSSRNTGIDNASGEYIWFIDSDDWIAENALEVIYNKFQENDCDSVWCNILAHVEPNHSLKILHDEENTMHETGLYTITPENISETTTYAWSKVYRLSKIKDNNIRFPDGLLFEESEFFFKFFTKMPVAYYIHDCLYHYRRRVQSIVTTSHKGDDSLLDMFTVYNKIYDYAVENGLFDQYQRFFVSMLVRHIRNHARPNMHEKIIKVANDIIDKIDFPNAFNGNYD